MQCCFFFQAEDGIRDAQESRGLGDVYKRQDDYLLPNYFQHMNGILARHQNPDCVVHNAYSYVAVSYTHLTLPTIHPV